VTSPLQFPAHLRPEYLRVLSETATLLLRDSTPDEVARLIFNKLAPLLHLDAYFHYLVNPSGSDMELQSCAGAPTELLPSLQRLPLGVAVCGTVAERCQMMYVPDVQARTDEMTDFIRGCGIRCYVCHPLIANGELLGTFSFGTKQRSSYSAEEQELLYLVAQQVALAVSRRRQAERLQHMEKLAVAGRLAASISHEINNPLEAVSNLLYLLRSEELSDAGREYLALAGKELSRVSEITKQVLGFYRSNRTPTPVRVRSIVDHAVTILRERININDVRVTLRIPDEASAFACSGELQQVILNLLKNAIDAVGTGGGIEVQASINDSGLLELLVIDSGPGVAPEAVARIFEPFFTTKTNSGTGLGLWVAQQLVRKNGGNIQFISSTLPPTGTRVSVFLPAYSQTLSTYAAM